MSYLSWCDESKRSWKTAITTRSDAVMRQKTMRKRVVVFRRAERKKLRQGQAKARLRLVERRKLPRVEALQQVGKAKGRLPKLVRSPQASSALTHRDALDAILSLALIVVQMRRH
jgi:hypothetical protein